MKRAALTGVVFAIATWGVGSQAYATDFTMPVGGHVFIVFDGQSPTVVFHNSMSVVQPDDATFGFAGGADATHPKVAVQTVGVTTVDGCNIGPQIGGLPGVVLFSERTNDFGVSPDVFTQRGCRVNLVPVSPTTSDPAFFPAGTVFRFAMCSKITTGSNCDYIWVSEHTKSEILSGGTFIPGDDGLDHLHTIPNATDPNNDFEFHWEDQQGGGDFDYVDMLNELRIDGDKDGDGLWDDWEMNGISDASSGAVILNLPALGANPNVKDVFVHLDYMDCAVAGSDPATCAGALAHNHQPDPMAIAKIVTAYSNAGITLHVDSSPVVHSQYVNLTGKCNFNMALDAGVTDFDVVKKPWLIANPGAHWAFHYGLIGHLIKQTGAGSGATGCSETPGNDFLVTLAGVADAATTNYKGSIQEQAGTIMHELGHNMDLHHGGGPHCAPLPGCLIKMDSLDHKPHYLSVMNYLYQLTGIPCASCGTGSAPTGRVDYSNVDNGVLDETSLDETKIIAGGSTDYLMYYCPAGTVAAADSCPGAQPGSIGALVTYPGKPINAGIPWDCDTTPTSAVCSSSADNNVVRDQLSGYNDWANLYFNFQTTGDFEEGVHQSPTSEVPVTQLQPPIPIINAAASCECGSSLPLDGTASKAPNGSIATYGWSFTSPSVIDVYGSTTTLACSVVATDNIWLTVTDNAGLSAVANQSVIVSDTKPPVLTLPANISATADSSCGGANVSFTVSALDACVGVVPVSCNATSGQRFPLGTTVVTCSASDGHGNTATGSFNVSVTYSWSGFSAPIAMDGSSVFKLGSTIPTKFTLTGASAGCTAAIAHLLVEQVSPTVSGTYFEDTSNVGVGDNGSDFRFDASSGTYIFNASTKIAPFAVGTWRWRVDFVDGNPNDLTTISLK